MTDDDRPTIPALPSGVQPLPGMRPPARLPSSMAIRTAYEEHCRSLTALVVELEHDLRETRPTGRARLALEVAVEQLTLATAAVRRARDERLREIE